mmetsp:Transcript_18870/g.46321  ORF Transcript_18870/g.46321 Transcript_18870/m.46321 type:complete len:106 (+) Transcript_18870:1282-1599(+)
MSAENVLRPVKMQANWNGYLFGMERMVPSSPRFSTTAVESPLCPSPTTPPPVHWGSRPRTPPGRREAARSTAARQRRHMGLQSVEVQGRDQVYLVSSEPRREEGG